MLGHIGISALGGYYAQDVATGAVVDTYVPTSFVHVKGIQLSSVTIEKEKAVFNRVFADSFVYVKHAMRTPPLSITYPRLATIGTTGARTPRTWWYGGAMQVAGDSNRYFVLYVNENKNVLGTYSATALPLEAWTTMGELTVTLKQGTLQTHGAVAYYHETFTTADSVLQTGPAHSYCETDIYAEVLINRYYNAAWFNMPVRSLVTGQSAVFEHFNSILKEML